MYLKFLKTLFILGDIGFYNTNLHNVVNSIQKVITNDDIIVILGDNFYPSGVTDINDNQWNNYNYIFNNITNPIYSILGNHDYLLNPLSQCNTTNWNMPNWYYKKEYENIELYFLDTVQFDTHNGLSTQKIESVHNSNIEYLIENQLSWLESELSKNMNKSKIVFGHYPIITNGIYIYESNKVYNYLIDIFKKYNVKSYISGHEHNIQYIKKNIDNYIFNQIIIGSSSENRSDKKECLILNDNMLDNSDNFYGKIIFNNDTTIHFLNKNNELKYVYDL